YDLQTPGSYLNFKTDSLDLYQWTLEEIPKTRYQVQYQTEDLHNSPWGQGHFMTGFERIFLAQNMKINSIRLIKP
ncbi:class I SAM-dependent methyltransferase, partial [Eggerthella sinensis]|uniref:hypothetical protein n=1 Tax=Eggerthella sinensis TaxID=242230 RepID=UPI001D099158